MAQMAKYRQK